MNHKIIIANSVSVPLLGPWLLYRRRLTLRAVRNLRTWRKEAGRGLVEAGDGESHWAGRWWNLQEALVLTTSFRGFLFCSIKYFWEIVRNYSQKLVNHHRYSFDDDSCFCWCKIFFNEKLLFLMVTPLANRHPYWLLRLIGLFLQCS